MDYREEVDGHSKLVHYGPGRGSVQHARLIFVDKGKMLRMEGAFGPLQGEAIVATLTFELTPDGDRATKVKMTYIAGGYSPTGFDKLAPAVDSVLGAQLDEPRSYRNEIHDAHNIPKATLVISWITSCHQS